jgi:hypothetical protein
LKNVFDEVCACLTTFILRLIWKLTGNRRSAGATSGQKEEAVLLVVKKGMEINIDGGMLLLCQQ